MNDRYNKIIDDIIARSGNDFKKMSLADKMVSKNIMMETKEYILSWIENNWDLVEFWCALDIGKEIDDFSVPDFNKIRNLELYKSIYGDKGRV
ncbi:hypothetical protein EDC18_102402 [Natranaerovirga pectinivora]|uniref:Uncharacterized protein n=1 Tax=Natranaerovirga pectinivora TaxID=682400 RepID=A0A4R3MN15_9FIRM|nr:hypothetical protein [Natranaerovirga pectinivora]TCT16383.1 hypothetical protein EDC18_102402 [Natranaerovirga pectinivora]